MKRHFWLLGLLLVSMAMLFAFTTQRTGSVKGTITPSDGAAQVWVLSSRDTLRGVIRNGSFEVTGIIPGTCALVVEGLAPYKRTVRSGIEVYEGTQTNVGEILLEQQQR